MIYITGPGHGGPALVANAYLEGTYSEVYPNISQDEEGMKRLFKQFSLPRRHPQPRRARRRPARSTRAASSATRCRHAYGAAFDNPDLIVACVVGDGEAETGPLATSWHGNKFLNPARDGAVLPILHLNGYKIANPCFLARIPQRRAGEALRGLWLHAVLRRGRRPGDDAPADGRDARHGRRGDPADPGRRAQQRRSLKRPRWPMIVFRTPKGWTGPKEIDGKKCEGYWRSHQVPMGDMDKPEHVKILEAVDEELPARGAVRRAAAGSSPSSPSWRPKGTRRMSANPHANGGLLLRDLKLPDFRDYAVDVPSPGRDRRPRRRA